MKIKKPPFVEIAEILRVIGHPKRVEILFFLNNRKTNTSVTEVYENLGLTQSETSRHLSILKSQGILFCKKGAGHTYYFINYESPLIKEIVSSLSKY